MVYSEQNNPIFYFNLTPQLLYYLRRHTLRLIDFENTSCIIQDKVKTWEQRKLGDMLDRYEDPVETPHDGYERIGIRSHAKGVFHSYVEPGKELDTAKMHRVAADKFILNITFTHTYKIRN